MAFTRQRSSLPKEIDEKLRSLRKRDSPQIRAQTVADASDLLESLRSDIEGNRENLTRSQIIGIRSKLGRWCAQEDSAELRTIRFNDPTVRAACDALLS